MPDAYRDFPALAAAEAEQWRSSLSLRKPERHKRGDAYDIPDLEQPPWCYVGAFPDQLAIHVSPIKGLPVTDEDERGVSAIVIDHDRIDLGVVPRDGRVREYDGILLLVGVTAKLDCLTRKDLDNTCSRPRIRHWGLGEGRQKQG